MTPRQWVLVSVLSAALLGLLLNKNFRITLSRLKTIGQYHKDLSQLNQGVEEMKSKLDLLERNPRSYERLVRLQLGYLRPKEKEVRFIKRPESM